MNYYYIFIALAACYIVYKIFTFVKRKIRWAIATLPMFTMMGGIHLPPGKWQHLVAIFS